MRVGVAILVLIAAGCQAPMTPASPSLLARGELGVAREAIYRQRTDDREDRAYLLDRLRAASLTLADGYLESAEVQYGPVYDFLRTQGVNADKTVDSVVFYEGVRRWKGEPFEQALAFTEVAMTQASLGSWDNARAAADNALFALRDFGKDERGGELDAQEIAERALRYERALAEGLTEAEAKRRAEEADFFETQYVPRESDFVLGYLLAGVANRELNRDDEAGGQFARVVELDRGLRPLAESFRGGTYNAVLIVGYGLGPRKEAFGPDGALARFRPRTRSSGDALVVRARGGAAERFPVVTDVNAMARDHRWTAFEDVRRAKSVVGRFLTTGGAITAVIGAGNDNAVVAAAGAGAAVLGLLTRAGSRADTRYADTMPQRYYAVPLDLAPEPTPITLQVDRDPASRITLLGLRAPAPGEPTLLRYVRLPGGSSAGPSADAFAGASPAEATLRYTTPDQAADVRGAALPIVLGGRDARPPTRANLRTMETLGLTGVELRNLLRDEGVTWTIEDRGGFAPLHVLEGGNSLVAPAAGTAGYTRLFAHDHPPYRPRTAALRQAYVADPGRPSPLLSE